MGKLIYVTNVTLDGYIEDEHGTFDLFPISDEVFASVTEILASTGTFLYGRRLYEAMAVWETEPALAARSELTAAFATAWQAADKVVYSTSLTTAPTQRTRIERRFDPTAIRQLKAAAQQDLMIGGAHLASQALAIDLVDECRLYLWPGTVGKGKPGLPPDIRLSLELVDERRFGNGVLLLTYIPASTR